MDGDVLGPERRRRWSDERKREIVLASFAPGVLVKDVCRRHDVSTSLMFAWRRQARNGGLFGSGLAATGRETKAAASFLPVHFLAADAGAASSPEATPFST